MQKFDTTTEPLVDVDGTGGHRPLVDAGSATAVAAASPTITSGSAYAAGQLIGGLIALLGMARGIAGSGQIQGLAIADKSKQNAPIDVVFFQANPSGTTFTDKAAFAPANADLLNMIGVASVTASSYSTFSANSVGTVAQAGLPFKLASGTTLYACLVCRGAPTYASTSDLQLSVSVLLD